MILDEYEQDLLEAIDGADNFEQVDNFEEELLMAKVAAKIT